MTTNTENRISFEVATTGTDSASESHNDHVVPMWKQRTRIFTHNKLAIASVAFLILLTLACYLGPLIHPTNQTNQALTFGYRWNSPPSIHHLLGIDSSGFDELGRILYGGEY